jgi:hypothetical protein
MSFSLETSEHSTMSFTHEPDLLSPQAVAVLKFDADHAYRSLVPRSRGDQEVGAKLGLLWPADMLEGGNVHPLLDVALGALWLWHDFLDQAHQIAQQNESAEGSWLHAIVHRREGDFSNSKYWYARCRALIGSGCELVDLVAAVHDAPDDPRYASAVTQQRDEWRTLFKHCIRGGGCGVGGGGVKST